MHKQLLSKLGILLFIGLLLIIPLQLIAGKISERSYYLSEAKQAVAKSWTSHQGFLPAVLVIPYEIHKPVSIRRAGSSENKTEISRQRFFVVPDKTSVSASIANDVRAKGIYKIPVYTAMINVSGAFDYQRVIQELERIKNEHSKVVVKAPYLSALISDPRGINSVSALTWGTKESQFTPGSRVPNLIEGFSSDVDFEQGVQKIEFAYQLSLRGMESLSMIPFGLDTSIDVNSSWPHPQFIGEFLPIERSVSESGYSARWQINSLASNIGEKARLCAMGECEALQSSTVGIKHIETVDVYVQSDRSVKYGLLFIGLCFISFFLFEVLAKMPVHPIQYSLVGLANAIFYLLLIALSENISFLTSYVIASLACIGLLYLYIQPILRNWIYTNVFASFLAGLYAILYVIINLEDFALMMGSLLTFVVLATVMLLTRKINWYQLEENLSKTD